MRTSAKWAIHLAALALAAGATLAPAYGQQSESSATETNLQSQAQQTINTFKQTDPSLDTFFQNAAGYAVFPTVGEGALIIGGAHGKGVVYQNNEPVGMATVTKGSVGAQIGGQSYSELIFFQTPQALQEFKNSNYRISADVSAVAAAANAAKTANYTHGVAVFTAGREGVMAQAAIGGQKFTYQPLPGKEGAVGGSTSPGGSTSSTNESGTLPK